ncbi:MAG: TIGR00730 family Rossman fold protein [Nitrospinota bacterium]
MSPPREATKPQDVKESLHQLIEQHGGSANADLIREIMMTALRMAEDGTGRGDLKLLNSAFKELRHAFHVFAPYRRKRKVSIFGSARTAPDSPDYRQAREFASRMAQEGFMVITGAGPGIMEAANAGAGKEMSFGVNILLPFEQGANRYLHGDHKLVHLKYFFTRKLLFVKETDAVALFPGGFGTQDEGFELLTLIQTGKSDPLPIVFLDAPGGGYWRDWLEYVQTHLVDTGKVSEEDLALLRVTDDVEEAVQEICRFYHRYHSIRFVRDRLVIRLSRPLPEGRLEALNEAFSDILVKGRIEATSALPEESNETDIAHLDRLALYFNRAQYGRLRLLIDRINEA